MIRSKKTDYGITKAKGPMATVYACPCCKFQIRIPVSRPGSGVGRGYGLRTGGAAFSQMVGHINAEHPEHFAKGRENGRDVPSAARW